MGFQTKNFLWMLGALVAGLVPSLKLVEAKPKVKAEESMILRFKNQLQQVLSEGEQCLAAVSEAAAKLAKSPEVKRSLTGSLSEQDRRAFAVEATSLEPVSLAARLCGAAGPGETYAVVPDGVAQGEIAELDAKGFSGKVQTVNVESVEGREGAPADIR